VEYFSEYQFRFQPVVEEEQETRFNSVTFELDVSEEKPEFRIAKSS